MLYHPSDKCSPSHLASQTRLNISDVMYVIQRASERDVSENVAERVRLLEVASDRLLAAQNASRATAIEAYATTKGGKDLG